MRYTFVNAVNHGFVVHKFRSPTLRIAAGTYILSKKLEIYSMFLSFNMHAYQYLNLSTPVRCGEA